MLKSCDTCFFVVLKDYGYSNYTTEGTEVHCTLRKHPDGPFDRWFGEEEKLSFAEKCESYSECSSPRHLAVEDPMPHF